MKKLKVKFEKVLANKLCLKFSSETKFQMRLSLWTELNLSICLDIWIKGELSYIERMGAVEFNWLFIEILVF